MDGWSSMRFCSMKGQDSIAHLENEIHFHERRPITQLVTLFVPHAYLTLESTCS
jgi:hypothetical protein